MDIIGYLVLISFGFNVISALILHFRSARTTAHKFFELTAFAIAGWCFSMFMYRYSSIYLHEKIWAMLLYFFPAIIPAGFLMFGLHFPDKKVKKSLIFIIVLACSAMSLSALIPGVIIVDVVPYFGGEKLLVFGPLYVLYVMYIPLMFFLSYIALFRTYTTSASAFVRTQVKYIVLALTISSGLGMFSNLILPTFGIFTLNWLGQVATFIWVGSVTYAIIRHRLLDIRMVVIKSIAYSLLLLFLALLYMSLFFFIRVVITQEIITLENLVSSTVTVLFLAFGFQPLREVFEEFTNSIFNKQLYDTNDLLYELNKNIVGLIDFTSLSDKVISIINDTMNISKGAVLLINNQKIIKQNEHHWKDTFLPDISMDNLLAFLQTQKHILVFDEMKEGNDKDILRKKEIHVMAPLIVEKKLVGLLLLGGKKSGEAYSTRDIDVLDIIKSELAIAMKNVLSYEEIQAFNVTLKQKIDQATKELQKANIKLEELDKLKDEFVSVASHELRTPMTAIRSYLYLAMKKKPLSTDLERYITRSYNSTLRLINLVNDMLNISRIESGRLNYSIERIELNKILHDVLEEIQPRSEELDIKINLSADCKGDVAGDSDKLKSIIINILGTHLNSLLQTVKYI